MAEFVRTHQGGAALHFEGHKYLKIREGKNGMVFRTCSQHKSSCTARATSEKGEKLETLFQRLELGSVSLNEYLDAIKYHTRL